MRSRSLEKGSYFRKREHAYFKHNGAAFSQHPNQFVDAFGLDLLGLDKQDVVISASFSPCSRETVCATSRAAAGAWTLGIVDRARVYQKLMVETGAFAARSKKPNDTESSEPSSLGKHF